MNFMLFMILGTVSAILGWVFLVDHSWSAHAASQESVVTFYNWVGSLHDLLAIYERPAIDLMLDHCQIEPDSVIFEFGYGTGVLAESILSTYPDAKYFGVDISKSMFDVTKQRLKRFEDRADIQLATNSIGVLKAMPDRSISRFISTFVFDVLPKSDQKEIVTLLKTKVKYDADSKICLTSVTSQIDVTMDPLAHYMINGWNTVSRFCKVCLGGIRPINLRYGLDIQRTIFNVSYEGVVTEFGIPSQVLIAQKKTPEPYNKRKQK